MYVLELKTGDLDPPIRRRVISAQTKNPMDFPGATVYFSMIDIHGTRVINRQSGTMEEDSNGNACIPRYQWSEGDTDIAGTMRGQFLVIPTSGRPFSVPGGKHYLPIVIGTNIVTTLTTTSTTTTT